MRFLRRELFCLFLAMLAMEMVLLRRHSNDVPYWFYSLASSFGVIPFELCERIIPKSGAVLFEQGGCRVRVETLWWNTFYLTTAGGALWLGIRRHVIALVKRACGMTKPPIPEKYA